jgi:hypothetical protein
MGVTLSSRDPRGRRVRDIETSRAAWSLRFYCWRNVLWLSVGTVVAAATVVAIVEGRPPPLFEDFMTLLSRL